mgnify:CR=1 FL=1
MLGIGLDEKRRHVHLSDGGGVENLGIYELIRRRVRYLIVTDAGADPQTTLGDLGQAIERVRVRITGAPVPARAWIERVDDTHANATAAWRQMKKPEYLDRAQIERLQAASELVKEAIDLQGDAGTIDLEVDLPPHAVAAVTIAFGIEPATTRKPPTRRRK